MNHSFIFLLCFWSTWTHNLSSTKQFIMLTNWAITNNITILIPRRKLGCPNKNDSTFIGLKLSDHNSYQLQTPLPTTWSNQTTTNHSIPLQLNNNNNNTRWSGGIFYAPSVVVRDEDDNEYDGLYFWRVYRRERWICFWWKHKKMKVNTDSIIIKWNIRKSANTFARAVVMKMVGKCKTVFTRQTPRSEKIVSPRKIHFQWTTSQISIVNNAIFTKIISKTPTTCRRAKPKISYIQHTNNIKSKEK